MRGSIAPNSHGQWWSKKHYHQSENPCVDGIDENTSIWALDFSQNQYDSSHISALTLEYIWAGNLPPQYDLGSYLHNQVSNFQALNSCGQWWEKITKYRLTTTDYQSELPGVESIDEKTSIWALKPPKNCQNWSWGILLISIERETSASSLLRAIFIARWVNYRLSILTGNDEQQYSSSSSSFWAIQAWIAWTNILCWALEILSRHELFPLNLLLIFLFTAR